MIDILTWLVQVLGLILAIGMILFVLALPVIIWQLGKKAKRELRKGIDELEAKAKEIRDELRMP